MAILALCGSLAGCGRTDVDLARFSASASDGRPSDDDDGGTDTVTTGFTTGATDTFVPTTSSSPTSPTSVTVTVTETETITDSDDTDDVECEIAAQCPVDDPCQAPSCVGGICIYALLDADDDGFPPFECGGEDCNDLNPNTNPGTPEDCFDGDDNDCNGVADCFDPVCDGVPDCGCEPSPGGEVCTNGADDDCDTTVDCLDTDCIGTPACGCAMSEAGLCDNGFDDDCDDLIDCDDPECAGTQTCVCQGTAEDCSNGEDDDCDLLVDCGDPDCEGVFPCTCAGAPTPEFCGDGIDNDCNDLVDCADPVCFVAPECDECVPEICDDGEDNDCNNQIDCADPACAFAPGCEAQPEICNNGLDDDNDTLVDCDDPQCAGVPLCQETQNTCDTAEFIPGTGTYTGETFGNTNNHEGSCGGGAGEAIFFFVLDEPSRVILDSIGSDFDTVLYVRRGACASGAQVGCDDDSGGSFFSARLDFTLLYPGTYYVFLDGYTIDPFGGPNEGNYVLNVEIIPDPPEICDDGIDNDGDVYSDCGDPDCANVPPCAGCNGGANPTAEFGVEACTDGLDNDCDGQADCADDDCSASDFYVTECCNGTDENGNGIPDDFNCRCNNDSECSDGQICYDDTANACGIPCTSFFGDVCPFVAPGSTCNAATDQCSF
ncbi:MAG: MopE-related protein [Nannocystaceae bacterium]|nr:MopE-related protein [bacterium]